MKQNGILHSYIWLLQTLLDKGAMTFGQINSKWVADQMNLGNALPKTTFHRYRREIEDVFGLIITCDDHYRYYIENPHVLFEENVGARLYAGLSDGFTLLDCGSIADRIMVEATPSARYFLKDIISSMKTNSVLEVVYKKYHAEQCESYRLQPYYLKLYHQKWYLVGRKEDGCLHLFCLDRMKDVRDTKDHFRMPDGSTAQAYFRYSLGVMVDEGVDVCKVVLRAYGTEPSYLRDLPLHPSQHELDSGNGYTDFAYRLRPSLELVGKIMERGGRLEVISPPSLRQQVVEKLEDMLKKHK